MDLFTLFNLFFSTLANTLYLISVSRNKLEIVKRYYNKLYPEDSKITDDIIIRESNHIAEILFLIIADVLILTIGYLFLFFLHSDIPWLSAILETGIQVPFFLMIYGFAIKYIYKLHVKKKNTKPLDTHEIEEIVVVVSVIILLSFLVINPKISLFILAIILGKYIWIDFVLENKSIINKLRALFEKLTARRQSIDVLYICRLYAVNYFFDLLITNGYYYLMCKKFCFTGIDLIISMSACYTVLISMLLILNDNIKKSMPV